GSGARRAGARDARGARPHRRGRTRGDAARRGKPVVTRIGVLGGTFDPVHSGHVALALAVRQRLGFDRVDLVPSHSPPHRPSHRPAPSWHRWAMVVLACWDAPGLHASDREIRRGGLSFMLETLRSYRDHSPAAEPILVLGADAFAELPDWREPRSVVSEFGILVVNRPGYDCEEVLRSLPEWLAGRVIRP